QGGVEGDQIVDAFGEGRRQRIHYLAHAPGDLQRVGIRQLVDADDGGRHAVKPGGTRVVGGGEFDAGDVLEVDDGPVGPGAHHDVAVLLRTRQTCLPRGDVLHLLPGGGRFGADGAGGRRDVLVVEARPDALRGAAEGR